MNHRLKVNLLLEPYWLVGIQRYFHHNGKGPSCLLYVSVELVLNARIQYRLLCPSQNAMISFALNYPCHLQLSCQRTLSPHSCTQTHNAKQIEKT
jgi:hypothetical protein